ncbi:MAG: hypothetical protein KBT31_00890, partial [Firmicutes bacterium]|nr:hypothetical protein [Candidatus Colimorpha enterica]
FFINMRKKGENDRSGSLKWFLAALGCFVGNGGIAVVRKIQQVEFDGAYDNEYAFIMAGSSFIVFLIISLVREKDDWKHFFSPSRLYAAVTGICNGSQNFLSLLINSMLVISLAGPLTVGINTIVYFSVSLIFFREKYSRNQLIGVMIGVASVILLSF